MTQSSRHCSHGHQQGSGPQDSWLWPRGRTDVGSSAVGTYGHVHEGSLVELGVTQHVPSWLPLPDCWSVCRYVRHYGLGGACDDIASLLKQVAVRLGKTQKVKVLTGTGEKWGHPPPAGLGEPADRAAPGAGGGHCGHMWLFWEHRFCSGAGSRFSL